MSLNGEHLLLAHLPLPVVKVKRQLLCESVYIKFCLEDCLACGGINNLTTFKTVYGYQNRKIIIYQTLMDMMQRTKAEQQYEDCNITLFRHCLRGMKQSMAERKT